MKRDVLLALGLVLLVAVGVMAQSTLRHFTEIPVFMNGYKLGGDTAPTITGASGTGTGALLLPTNSVGLGREVSGFATVVRFCGDLANATSSYLGPGLLGLNGAPTDYTIAGTACSGLDSTTEATADAPISTLAVKVLGMLCKQAPAPGAGNSVVYTFRDNAADAVTTDGGGTTISCTISGATATECRSIAGSTTDIPAGDPVAVKALASYDASTHDAACSVLVSWP